ncbi:E2 protein [human papillomavirus 102]|uniref:Regulatory protein E2 n=1 Tax=human papillomavirus 102 TaxID=338327 RepID=Q2VJB7_9PAPI|nr:E2 protein [human papillomavirus 102]ALT55109.1 E2 [human papillomavirus 102]
MASLADRLDACQEMLIDLYEKDSNKLEDQLLHWQCVRREHAILFRAREAGHTSVGHQVVPPLSVTKTKACQAIAVHLSLQSLNNSDFKYEPWTLQDTSMDMWNTPPQGCWKKKGCTVTVKFDNSDCNEMDYVSWGHIYVNKEDTDTWYKVPGRIDYAGLYYEVQGCKHYYVAFAKEALKYGTKNIWEVHVGNNVIHQPCDSVSSTQDTVSEVPLAATCDRLPHADEPTTSPEVLGTTQSTPQVQAPPCKRQRLYGDGAEQPDATEKQHQKRLDTSTHGFYGDTECPKRPRDNSDSNNTPVIHLQGEANKLKCFRYRLHKFVPTLLVGATSTWHWTCGETATKATFVTLRYSSVEQRNLFLSRVTIPKGIKAMQGHMSMCF